MYKHDIRNYIISIIQLMVEYIISVSRRGPLDHSVYKIHDVLVRTSLNVSELFLYNLVHSSLVLPDLHYPQI